MRDRFLAAMAACATGVHIVTTDGAAGRYGLTVSAMASVSADPPLLLVCVNRRSPLAGALVANRRFAVNVLGEHQSALADRFAGRPCDGGAYTFDPAEWQLGGGPPVLADAPARMLCSVASATPAGSHLVVVGAVRSATRSAVRPLAYTRRGYAHVTPVAADAGGPVSDVAQAAA